MHIRYVQNFGLTLSMSVRLAGMWSNPLTFVKHYALDLVSTSDAKFWRTVLLSLYD